MADLETPEELVFERNGDIDMSEWELALSELRGALSWVLEAQGKARP